MIDVKSIVDLGSKDFKLKIAGSKKGRMKWYSFIFFFLIYHLLINYIDPSLNIVQNFFEIFSKPEYVFYTGVPTGTYHEIGSEISAEKKQLNIELKKTDGGYENAMKVSAGGKVFGIVQEDALVKDDPLRANLNYITPLFVEKLHILFNKKQFENNSILEFSNPKELTSPFLLTKLSKPTTNIFIGPIGSGTRILSTYVLSMLNKQVNENNLSCQYKTHNDNPDSVYAKLARDQSLVDIFFFVGGTPIHKIDSLLETGNFGLISVSPSFIAELNIKYNVNLRNSDFKGKYSSYSESDQINTIGTLAYLITPRETKQEDIDKILSLLVNYGEKHKGRLEFDIENRIVLKQGWNANFMWMFFRHILIFLMSYFGFLYTIWNISIWFWSSKREVKYIKEINELSKRIPDNTIPLSDIDKEELLQKVKGYPIDERNRLADAIAKGMTDRIRNNIDPDYYKLPYMIPTESIVINNIILSISDLTKLRRKLFDELENGDLVESHYTFLNEKINTIVDKLRKSLGTRLYQLVSSEKEIETAEQGDNGESIKTKESLSLYLVGEYIDKDWFELIMLKLTSPTVRH